MESPASAAHVLIVDDEPALAELVAYTMQAQGFSVATAANGLDALRAVERRRPDAIVLDWELPDMPGVALCRALRAQARTRDVPVILLTARADEDDRVAGLDAGADDYVVKPFSTAELTARLHAVLRRGPSARAGEKAEGPGLLERHGVALDAARRRVSRDGRPLTLGPVEFRMLECLMSTPGQIWSRERLLDTVWRDASVQPRTIDVTVRRLRSALGEPGLIHTVRATGYVFGKAGMRV